MKTRFFNFNRAVPAFLIVCLMTGIIVWQTSLSAKASANDFAPPQALTGGAAVKRLKQTGDYESLSETMLNARASELPSNDATAFIQTAKLLATESLPSDFFGYTIALSGETAIVGSFADDVGGSIEQGSAFIFVKSGGGWILQQRITAADGIAGDEFGGDVAIDGNTVVVGTAAADIGSNSFQGAAYVFVRSGTTWTQQAKLSASDGAGGDRLGTSVAVSGNTILAGASRDDSSRGSAYVFVRSGTIWTQQMKLTAADGASNDEFGRALAINGETAVIGANHNSPNGAVYVYVRSGSTWALQAKLNDTLVPSTFRFGEDVDIDGNYIVVGSLNVAASIFVRNGTTWTQQQRIAGTENQSRFAQGVAISGSLVIIGANTSVIGTQQSQGAAYIFERSGTTWTQQQKLISSDGNVGDNFGYGVDIDGNRAVVSTLSDSAGTVDEGQGYVFENNAVTGRKAYDFDGDGKADVSVFRPSNGTWYLQQSTSGFAGFAFGANGDLIAPADYDGDGKTDIAVFRPSNGTWYLQRSQLGFTGVLFGASGDVPMPGDFDNDGKADIAVFRPSNGTWYIQQSTAGFTGVVFGANGDVPVAADYDGDGKTDVAVFRPTNGTWYLNRSQLGFTGVLFGANGDKPVPADYDNDGKADVAVFRPSNGTWYLQQSTAGFTGVLFGANGDLPAPADFDGDGKADVTVFRPSNGTWYLNRSTQGFTGVLFGANGDKPAPNAFVP